VPRLVLRPSWIALLLLTVLLAVAFVGLGRWQLDRLDQRRAQNALVEAAREARPVPVDQELAAGRPVSPDGVWRRVTATGTYDRAHEVLVRGRAVADRTGLLVVTPLVTADGTALLVVRGWTPPSSRDAATPPDVPAAPDGTVTVTGRVRASERGAVKESRGEGPVQVARLDVDRVGEIIGRPVYGGYVELLDQQPPGPEGLVAIPEPAVADGPHLSYAVQWFCFAVLALGGYGYLAWRTAQVRREAAAAASGRPPGDAHSPSAPPSRSPSTSR